MRADDARPVVAITMGDAAGIGPEIVLKALAQAPTSNARCIIVGDLACLERTAAELSMPIDLCLYDADGDPDRAIAVYDLKNLSASFAMAADNAVTGKASAEYIEAAVNLWKSGEIDAICTAPISKKAIALGGYDFPGHTEFLAKLTGTSRFAMSFFGGDLRVVLLSTHLSLRDAIGLVTEQRLVDLIGFSAAEMERLLGKRPSIAVAGLNPHASEGGLFGREEQDEIIPAIDICRAQGIDVTGPFSPDTIFLRASRGEFDAVIALYHDQATIPVKSLSFGSAVNVTLGLPLIRTSVDHGTAYDIAGMGVADPSSMQAAIELAGSLVNSSQMTKQIC